MKKLTLILALVAAVLLHSQAFAHQMANPQSRAYKKAARKAQKDRVKYSRQQQKAMRKSAKAQRKALKRAQSQNHYWECESDNTASRGVRCSPCR